MLKLNPWFKIWVSPKETLRAIKLYDPKFRFMTLSFIYGFLSMLSICQTLSLGHFYSVSAILLASIIFAIPLGYIMMSISSCLFLWTGKLFKGQASYIEIRAAISWANVPSVVNIITWLILIAAHGARLFMADMGHVEPGFDLADTMYIIQAVIAIWSVVILILGVSEVQGFSGWRGLGNFIVVTIIWFFIMMAIMYFTIYYAKPDAVAFIESI